MHVRSGNLPNMQISDRPLVSLCRPVYIEICACVVRDAVKCSFECLRVVHHTCCKHSVGVEDGEIIKSMLKSTLDQLPMVKKTKSNAKKKLGISSAVICILFVTPYPFTLAYLKIWAKQM